MESKTTQKKENPWLSHLAAFRAAHPEVKGKDVISEAIKTYTPKNSGKPTKAKKKTDESEKKPKSQKSKPKKKAKKQEEEIEEEDEGYSDE